MRILTSNGNNLFALRGYMRNSVRHSLRANGGVALGSLRPNKASILPEDEPLIALLYCLSGRILRKKLVRPGSDRPARLLSKEEKSYFI
ncbi:Hypothetical protein NTJ_13827 [Nesidiocoris tenuis]|uniref:Uncharacterized protein n=1 Tax=Nesidiocoris tenuis TaxID=355587 RepID=A0ABN7BCT7_9HEMI|nr:Hypothetical protein NTJ_13827 [Nesidiocoris tenuis]